MIRSPEYLWLLLLLIPTALIYLNQLRIGGRSLKSIGGGWRQNILYDVFLIKWFLSFATLVVFIILISFSLSEFSWGKMYTPNEKESLDVVYCVDVSRSMYSRDIRPSRLERSGAFISSLNSRIGGGRAGIVVFKGEAFIAVPLTEDQEALESFLSVLNTETITAPGTNLEAGLAKAAELLMRQSGRNGIIILLSDGEALSGNLQRIAEDLNRQGISVYSVGVGTPEGSKIPLANGSFVLNDKGEVVISRLDTTMLRNVSSLTGGSYLDVNDNRTVTKILDEAKRRLVKTREDEFVAVQKDQYSFFLFWALIFLILHIAVRFVKWRNTF